MDSGTCGENLTWQLDEDGTLTISGQGEMSDYELLINESPWHSACEDIKTIIIGEGVTAIGKETFNDCKNVTKVVIPAGITRIGDWAFAACASLKEISLPEGVQTIENGTFAYCKSIGP